MQNETGRTALILLMGACLALVGCEGGGDNAESIEPVSTSANTPAATDVTGTWRVLSSSGVAGTMVLVQKGTTVEITWMADGGPDIGGGVWTASIDGNILTLDGIHRNDQTHAVLTVQGNTMTGIRTSTDPNTGPQTVTATRT